MKGFFITLGAIVALFLMAFFASFHVKNTAIAYEQTIQKDQDNITDEEKRRFDLIPNLADCVKQYDKHESETLIELAKARSGGAEGDATMEEVKLVIQAVVEAYPQLQSQKNYLDFMDELTITENRIVDYRKIYNRDIADYGRYVLQFPNEQFLRWRRYEVKEYTRHEYEHNSVDAPKNLFD